MTQQKLDCVSCVMRDVIPLVLRMLLAVFKHSDVAVKEEISNAQ